MTCVCVYDLTTCLFVGFFFVIIIVTHMHTSNGYIVRTRVIFFRVDFGSFVYFLFSIQFFFVYFRLKLLKFQHFISFHFIFFEHFSIFTRYMWQHFFFLIFVCLLPQFLYNLSLSLCICINLEHCISVGVYSDDDGGYFAWPTNE